MPVVYDCHPISLPTATWLRRRPKPDELPAYARRHLGLSGGSVDRRSLLHALILPRGLWRAGRAKEHPGRPL